jgi:hypothetical protein
MDVSPHSGPAWPVDPEVVLSTGFVLWCGSVFSILLENSVTA